MTAKFEAFKAALEALCVEHQVRMRGGDDYDDYGVYIEPASAEIPAGLALELTDCRPPTPEEAAAEAARYAEERAAMEARAVEYRKAEATNLARLKETSYYRSMQQIIDAHDAEQRKHQMRVSTDPKDPAYIDDRPRRVWSNDREITDWVVADEFRRCVIDAAGKVHNGSVRIERLDDPGAQDPATLNAAAAVANSGFVSVFEHAPEPKPVRTLEPEGLPPVGTAPKPETVAPPVVDKPAKVKPKRR